MFQKGGWVGGCAEAVRNESNDTEKFKHLHPAEAGRGTRVREKRLSRWQTTRKIRPGCLGNASERCPVGAEHPGVQLEARCWIERPSQSSKEKWEEGGGYGKPL